MPFEFFITVFLSWVVRKSKLRAYGNFLVQQILFSLTPLFQRFTFPTFITGVWPSDFPSEVFFFRDATIL